MTGLPLAGKRIVVTRAATQAAPLLAAIRAAGGEPLAFPVLEILPREGADLEQGVAQLDDVAWAVFVSPNAARHGVAAVRRRRTWPAALRAAAVGQGTARALRELGFEQVLAPTDGADSEALLALPEMQRFAGQRVVIFRGDKGRELLAQALTERGARVEYLSCYRRVPASVDPETLLKDWHNGAVHAVSATSTEMLEEFCRLIGERGMRLLQHTPLFVIHPRIAARAVERGLDKVWVTGPGDEALVKGMTEYFANDGIATN
jgi:uroporphyrinogen-III synthase